MKKLWIILAGLLPAAVMAQQEKAFTIKADFGTGVNNKVILNRYTLRMGQHQDTARIVDGKVRFKGRIDDERQYGQLIVMDGARGSIRSVLFYLEPGPITVDYTTDKRPWHYQLAGTPLNRDYNEYNRMLNDALDSFNTGQPADKQVDRFNPKAQVLKLEVIKRFVTRHPSSPIGLDQLNESATRSKDPSEIVPVYELLSTGLLKSAKGQELTNRIKGLNAAEIGKTAPAFTLPDTQGKEVSLADFKGKYVLIDFWATWCGPCLAEMPNVKNAYRKYKDRNFEIIGVSLDRPDSKQKWVDQIRKDSLAWMQVSDLKWWNSNAALLYNVNSVPANFLVDPEGKIIAKNLRAEALQKKLAELFPGGPSTTFAAEPSGNFVIDGRIIADTVSTGKIYLSYEDNGQAVRDSFALVNNTYHFQGHMQDGAIEANLFWEDLPKGVRFKGFSQFFVSPGQVTLIHKGHFDKVEITGSPIQQESDQLRKQRRTDGLTDKDRELGYIRAHPDSWLSYVFLESHVIRFQDLRLGEADSLYTSLHPALRKYARVGALKLLIDGRKAAVVGHPAIEFTEKDAGGHAVALSSYRGKYVLVDFWASWCHPCRAENPNVTAAYHKYKDKGLNILSVSLDATRDPWLKAVEHDKLEWTQVSNLKGFDDAAAVSYGVHAIPANFLIDPNGTIVASSLHGEELDKKLSEIFK